MSKQLFTKLRFVVEYRVGDCPNEMPLDRLTAELQRRLHQQAKELQHDYRDKGLTISVKTKREER